MAELLEQRSSISLQLIDALLEVFGEFNQLNIWSKVTKDDFTVKRFEYVFIVDIVKIYKLFFTIVSAMTVTCAAVN